MGVLYARVAGAWVPVANGVTPPFDPTPAWIGPRSDASAEAGFGHVSMPHNVGYFAGAAGTNYVITGDSAKPFIVYYSAGSGSYPEVARLQAGNSAINGWGIGTHPGHGLAGLWVTALPGNGDYKLLEVSSGATLINASAGKYVEVRINNVGKWTVTDSAMTVSPQLNTQAIYSDTSLNANTVQGRGGITSLVDVVANRRFYQQGGDPGVGWNEAQYTIAGGGYYGARYGFNYSGATGQWRLGQWKGNAIEAVAGDMGAYILVWASGFPTESTVKAKREVRSIFPERERITVRRDPWSDTVDPPDVMSLRPVAFRPKRGAMRWNEETQEHEPDDHPVWSHEGRRERLGLIAEEVETVIPSAVMHDQDGAAAGIEYAQITVALLAHVQQLTETVATLKYRITELENSR